MSVPEGISRREFTLASTLAILNGVTIAVTGCGDSAPPTPTSVPAPPAATPSPSGVEGVVSANHGHRAVIGSSQLAAGSGVTLFIDGEATHPHTVELSEDDVRGIANGDRIVKSSSLLVDDPLYPDVGTHQHSVTFN